MHQFDTMRHNAKAFRKTRDLNIEIVTFKYHCDIIFIWAVIYVGDA